MAAIQRARAGVKAARKRGAAWVRVLDVLRLLGSGEGRGQLWTWAVYRGAVHQTTPYTEANRYPALFDLAAKLRPDGARILSFGCSTGEEVVALRQRFPSAEIVGAEINPRSRRMAARRLTADERAIVVPPDAITGSFDLVFALAVLQREPHKVAEIDLDDLSSLYAFQQFDSAVAFLVGRLNTAGLLCVMNAHYRVEDSSSAALLDARPSPAMPDPLFGPDGRRLRNAVALSIFRKR